jgi:AcrR family transcriptional regulator
MNIHSSVIAETRLPVAEKADAILDAALDLFVADGFHGTAVPRVAERAGVGAGTIYRYFESKEALVNALYQRWKTAVGSRVVTDFPFDKPPREQFRTVWERMADFAVAHPREFAFLELHHHRSYLDATSLAMESQILDFGIAMIRKAQAIQTLRPLDPALLMALGFGAFIGVFRAGLEGKVAFSKEVLMAAEQCAWEAIRA